MRTPNPEVLAFAMFTADSTVNKSLLSQGYHSLNWFASRSTQSVCANLLGNERSVAINPSYLMVNQQLLLVNLVVVYSCGSTYVRACVCVRVVSRISGFPF